MGRNIVAQTPTPPHTRSWQPIAHLELIQVVERALLEQDLVIAGQAHALTHDGQRYFGLIEIKANNGYMQARIRDRIAHDLIIRAVDQGVIANRLVPTVLKEWREPKHTAFAPRTVWSLQNAFTETMKGMSLERLPAHTERLTTLLDAHVGMN